MKRRKALKLTQRQVAEAVGVTSRTVQSWELGEYIPTLNPLQMMRLCHLLKCSVDELARDFFPEEFESDGASVIDPGGAPAN
ncbi:MAG: helix-turn-helix transcriptional regulator [Cyanobacteria bacterium P01_C01_bin.120]